MSLDTPNCWKCKCKWFIGVKWLGDEEFTETNYCTAFPNGIPRTISYGENPHAEVQPGLSSLKNLREKTSASDLIAGRRGY